MVLQNHLVACHQKGVNIGHIRKIVKSGSNEHMYLQKVWTIPDMSAVFINLLYKQSVILKFTKNNILSSYC